MSEVKNALSIPMPIEGLTLKNEALNTIYTAFSRERAKTAEEIEALGLKAHGKVEAFNQKVAKAISKLPIDDKGKFPVEGFDGYKTPVEFVQKALGYKPASAYAIVAYAKTQADPNAPQVLKSMTIFNHDAVKASNQSDLYMAIARGEITAETSQSDLRKFASDHPAKRKNGEVKVVTTFTKHLLSGEVVDLAPEVEENAVETLKSHFRKQYLKGDDVEFELIKLPTVKVSDAGKTLTLRRYLAISGEAHEVYILRPTVKVDKPSIPAVAPTAEDVMVRNTMNRKGCTEAEARTFLRENGLID